MDNALIVPMIALLGIPLSIFLTWLFNRRKSMAEIYDTIAEGSESAMHSMQIAMAQMTTDLTRASAKIDLLQKEIENLRHQNVLLLEENHILRQKIEDLVKYITTATGEIPAISAEPSPPHDS